MKKLAALGLLAALAAAAGAHVARAAGPDGGAPRSPAHDPRDYAQGAAPADPADGAAPREPEPDPKVPAGAHKPWAPVPEASFPEGSSPAPTREEWDAAPPALDVRVTDPACAAKRIREWYRVGCTSGSWIEMISGARDGVSFECSRTTPQDEDCNRVAVVFAARRGDRRAFEIFRWAKWGPSPDVVVTEQFLGGDPAPLVTVHGLHWGF